MRSRPVLVCGALLALVACSSTESGGSLAPASTPPPSSVTTAESTLAPTTSDITTTTEVPVTAPATVGGWTPLDPASVEGQSGFPCCASNWYGVPSPPLPQQGQALPPNGSYAVSMAWAADPTAPLQLELRRFERCSALPQYACEELGRAFDPTELGIDDTAVHSLTVPLDDRVRVVLTGYSGFDDSGQIIAIAAGDGHDLADLAAAVEVAHATVLMSKFESGMTPEQIVTAVSNSPEGGFIAGLDATGMSLSFVHDNAPPLLFQAPFGFEDPAASRGTDVLKMPSIEMIDGILTVYVYAGYYP